MQTALTDDSSTESPGFWAQARLLGAHLLCFSFPLLTLTYLVTGPHQWRTAVPWFLLIVIAVVWDNHSKPVRRQPSPQLAAWPFDLVLYLLVLLQVINMVLLGRMVQEGGLWTVDSWVAIHIVGINSGYSAIVVAHELIHRPQRRMQRMGRLLLCTVMYDHFSVEHVRGHHARVGTDDDPATARFGETFRRFFHRTVPAQFRSAWHLENKRLGDETMGIWDRRQLGNRVLHGIIAECLLAALMGLMFGAGALVIFLLQAYVAVLLLEAVNYFEHWGLRRTEKKVRVIDSWDADSRFTLYSLVGLSRHADHHAHAMRPYQQLRHFEESPKLPTGYFGSVIMVIFQNARFQRLMTEELRRRRLGPFAADQGLQPSGTVSQPT